ncbi:condensation domain-containing protein [Actinomadura sp. ATCC 31491]|uniref:Condensation domain-containing protein n=1 Tax=Actinomadura luzonensis TaxID=2805427 RepID=A0ABT0FWD1_9ACTN|nr:condensation domain-containing protein [Actinomadura luzonensis]MCK2216226.1 condensation domain-containing protein [Actinomadura luzonensis]
MKSASLCWGQRYMWLRVHQLPPEHQHETHVVLRFQVPGGLTVAQCRAILTHLARRHEILRTTFPLDPEPAQRVEPPAALPVTVATTERDGTPGPAGVLDDLTRRPFDLAAEWPVRACLITTGGLPRQCVLVFNHLAVDAWTIEEIKRELRTQAAGLAARRPAALPPVRHQPSDLARHEASADAAIVAARSMAHWQEGVARLPRDPFARRRRDAEGAGHATLISPALLAAGRRVAARHGVWPSLVPVAAYAAMTARYTGQRTVGWLAFVSNRGSHPYPDVLTCMFSPMLVTVDASGDPPFGELLRRLAGAFEQAGEHAYVPYDKVVEMVSREGSRRGGEVRLGSEVNFIKQRSKEYGGRRTAFTWNPAPLSWARCGLDTYLRIDEWRDAVSLSLHAAAAVMGPAEVEWFLRGMEALVLAHDEGRETPAAPPPLPPPPLPAPPPVAAPVPAGPAPDAAVAALAEAVRETHGLSRVDPSDSYVLAGGQALRAPQVLARLAGRGWTGLTLQQLTGPAPLGALAARLAPGPRTPSTQIPSNSE